jgi:uncharacterized repeat protein (TIGR03803 family)
MRIGSLQTVVLAGLLALAVGGSAVAADGPRGAAPTIAEQTLYKFCPQPGCTGGTNPDFGGLLMDSAGNLYGTAVLGGTHSFGTVFKLASNGTGWTETVLYNFCSQGGGYCTDGAWPNGGLIMDAVGNLYGTTVSGGNQYSGCSTGNGCGTVFELSPAGSGWTEKVLYSFCAQGGNCTDGDNPGAGLIMDGAGNLYGTTFNGGNGFYAGTVFKLAPTGTGWTQSVLYGFCSQGGSYCTDGAIPAAGLIMDGAGNLYGTTARGGVGGGLGGTVFKLAPTITGWAETVLYSFCSQADCADGADPYAAGLVMDGAGNLYGTTPDGGKYNGGAVFQLSPNGSSWTQSVLYSFCSPGGSRCMDGADPVAGLIMDAAKNLYGTTFMGGAHNGGTVFKLVPTSSGASETVLYSFCSQTSCADGAAPAASLIMDGAGNLYGTTLYGGNYYCLTNNANPCGTVFRLTGLGYTLSASIIGNPGGRVTSSPSGIDCGSTCSASFAPGTQVTLTAGTALAWGLAGWGGACSGIASSCTLTLNGSASVSASFTTLFTTPQVLQPDAAALPPAVLSPLPSPPTAF